MLSQQELNNQIDYALAKIDADTQLGKRKSNRDSIVITPSVTFFEGTPDKPERFITAGKGRLTGTGLISIMNFISGSFLVTPYKLWMNSFGTSSPSIRLGQGTGATLYNTTQLVNSIATAPGTATGSVSNPSPGVYKLILNATWNAGTLGAIAITEAALYAYCDNILEGFGASPICNQTYLVDRISSTDGDFTSFTVNVSKPLTVQYTIQLSFA